MGNLNSMRDWGHARDYVNAVADASEQPDFVIATGRQESVRRFIELTAQQLGGALCIGRVISLKLAAVATRGWW